LKRASVNQFDTKVIFVGLQAGGKNLVAWRRADRLVNLSFLSHNGKNIFQMRVGLLLLAILTLVQVSPAPMQMWMYRKDALMRTHPLVPFYKFPVVLQDDLNQDGKMECLTLQDERAVLFSPNAGCLCSSPCARNRVWQSPSSWQVKQAHITDLNMDGKNEIALLVWRQFSPWQVDKFMLHGGRISSFHDGANRSCHLSLIGWRRGKYGEVWAGSALAQPVVQFAALDLNGDGRQELAVLEADYAQQGSGRANSLAVWEWNGFGFTRLTRITGEVNTFLPVRAGDKVFLLTEGF